ncbi:hypothetical protein EMN47_10995 [Prolixibacteraceae bacterium JC049]|nr:hypothetical protein [Prolixibacteraceae bacterium JC049]
MIDLKKVKDCFEQGDIQTAYEMVAAIEIEISDENELLLCAEVCKKVQKIAEAINWYNRLLELIPDHPFAKTQVQMLNSILEFRYKDLYNP